MSKEYRVAVVGATGAVGMAMRSILAERKFPVSTSSSLWLRPSRPARQLDFCGESVDLPGAHRGQLQGHRPGPVLGRRRHLARRSPPSPATPGCVVVDNSSAWRMDPDVPLVVPEVNPDDVDWHKGIIANPNCSTIQMVVVMKPLHDEARHQARGGLHLPGGLRHRRQGHRRAGAADRDRSWRARTRRSRSTRTRSPSTACRRSTSSSRTATPRKRRRWWTRPRRSWAIDSIAVTATCVRVPVQNSHSESVNLEFARPLSAGAGPRAAGRGPRRAGRGRPGRASSTPCPSSPRAPTTPTWAASGATRPSTNGLNLWVVADNLRKGAALNAVQIGELLARARPHPRALTGPGPGRAAGPRSPCRAIGVVPMPRLARRLGRIWLLVIAVVVVVRRPARLRLRRDLPRGGEALHLQQPGHPRRPSTAHASSFSPTSIAASSSARSAWAVSWTRSTRWTPTSSFSAETTSTATPTTRVPASRSLPAWRRRWGRFAVLGNHDYGEPQRVGGDDAKDPARAMEAIAAAGIALLDDRGVWLERDGERLRLGGVSDYQMGTPDVEPTLEGTSRDDFVILLSHNPDYAEELPAEARRPGALRPHARRPDHASSASGRLLPALGLRAEVPDRGGGERLDHGHRLQRHRHASVPPVRFFARPQIVEITLRAHRRGRLSAGEPDRAVSGPRAATGLS